MTEPRPQDDTLRQLLAGAAGLRWTTHLHGLATQRLQALASDHGSVGALMDAAQRQPEVAQALAAAFTVGETWFHRIGAQLDALPGLLAGRARPVNAWCAGCSTGEEAYALAAAFMRRGQTVRVLGTDLNPEAVAQAQRGEYGQWSLRGTTPEQVQASFEPSGARYRVRPELRAAVNFQVHNLLRPAPVRDMDVVSCRNVTIYFTPGAAAQVYRSLVGALVPGGYLLLAPSDPRPPADLPLETVRVGETQLMRRLPLAPTTVRRADPAAPASPGAARPERPAAAPPRAPSPQEQLAQARQAAFVNPQAPDVHLALARALLSSGLPDRAARALQDAQALLRGAPDTWERAHLHAECEALREQLRRTS